MSSQRNQKLETIVQIMRFLGKNENNLTLLISYPSFCFAIGSYVDSEKTAITVASV